MFQSLDHTASAERHSTIQVEMKKQRSRVHSFWLLSWIGLHVCHILSTMPVMANSGVEKASVVPSRAIRGVIRDNQGDPIEGALVLPFPLAGHPIHTDADGKFQLEDPTDDRSITSLLVRAPKHNLAAVEKLSDYSKPLDIALAPAVTLIGRVTDPQGRQITGARVSPWIKTGDFYAGWGFMNWPSTDSRGLYQLKALPVGHWYNVGVGGRGAKGFGPGCMEMFLNEPGRMELKDIVLQPANQSISGVALDDQDKPLSGLLVQATGKNQPVRKSKTDINGRFTIDGLCKGSVECMLWSSDNIWFGSDEVNAGDKNIEIFLQKHKLTCMLPAKHPPTSLVGKRLPNLNSLKHHLSNQEIHGKRILICFWKQSHDESREYMRRLAMRSEEFIEKDIIVIGVQIWLRNEKQLRRWCAKNNIKFPVSVLEDEWQQKPEERATYCWGIQNRVPWLVFTDFQHEVYAEGFAIESLDEKIEKTGSTPAKAERLKP